MQETIKTVRIVRQQFTDLSAEEKELFSHAVAVRNNAQAPYSQYHVGAAVLSEKNTMHVGCNVERCTYTQTTHAEQNAIDTMVAVLGPVKIQKIAVVGASAHIQISLPSTTELLKNMVCGHCLQIIWENSADTRVKIMLLEAHGIVACTTIGDLLPFCFGPENIQVKVSS